MLEITSAVALNLLSLTNAMYHLHHRIGRSASIIPFTRRSAERFVSNVSYVTELEIAKLADAFLVPKSDEWFVKECKNAVSHSIKVPCADSPRGQPPSQSRLSRTVISTAKASCSVRLLSGDRSREWYWSIGTTDSQSAMAASLTCKPVELPTVSMERLPSAVCAPAINPDHSRGCKHVAN